QTTVTPLPDAEPVETAPLTEASATDALAEADWGDPQAGAQKAAVCAACHGVDGNPTDPMYPRVAGQSERYIARQLALFKSGERNTGMAAIMIPFATMLSAQDMRDVGAYYATQVAGAGIADDTVIATGPHQGMKFYQVGERLFRSGDAERGIPACMACHGPAGAGNPGPPYPHVGGPAGRAPRPARPGRGPAGAATPGPPYPHVGGQQADYVVRRLQEYRAGTTSESDPRLFNVMAAVAESLTDEEIDSLGSYL